MTSLPTSFGKEEKDRLPWGSFLLLGCFGTASFLMVVLIIMALVIPGMITRTIDAYTDERPRTIATVRGTPEQLEALEERIEGFTRTIESDGWSAPLRLTEDELNMLLHAQADDDGFDGAFNLELLDGQVKGEVSIPLDTDLNIGLWEKTLRGRYINGSATFDVRVRDHKLDMELVAFEVEGKHLPGWVLSQIREQIRRDGWLESDDVNEFLESIEDLDVNRGEVVVRAADPERN